ncbi:7160_t:CDS:2, partial [Cetraspora pellucida]
ERPYREWKLTTWEDFYTNKYPNKTKEESHNSFRRDLDVLISKLEPKTAIYDKALALKRDFLNLKKKSNSSIKSVERRFPDNISLWDNFISEDIWTAAEINIHDILTPLDRSVSFL